ncbi:MAG: SDR family oxidoreductase [Blastocatellia bacterium]|nr:SDR family oxidoreductase [Blastocatellia bacterium]MBK6425600.1 SDR family oxidoreductase [Blastocatellia bacterium]
MISLADKVALITGASRGIGAATARLFAQAGARGIVINYHANRDAAEAVREDCIAFGADAIVVRADVAKVSSVRAMVGKTVSRYGRLDIVVANAGIWKGAPIEEMSEAQWDETIDTNLKSVYATCSAAAAHMLSQGSGRIITVSSTAGQRGEAFHSHYAASKGGIISLTKALAAELGPRGIFVNSVAPGWVDTDMSAEPLASRAERRKIMSLIPLQRVATAEEIAGPILFLASDLSNGMTGEILNVNCGSVLCG